MAAPRNLRAEYTYYAHFKLVSALTALQLLGGGVLQICYFRHSADAVRGSDAPLAIIGGPSRSAQGNGYAA